MSGITPLLDTLLHQVLGKRVDTQPPKDLNQPVKPTSPADAPKALHSDSRLDARHPSTPLPGAGRTPGAASDRPSQPLTTPGPSPASTQTHLSRSALTIADLLVRFPAPPSSVSPATQLLPAGQAPTPAGVAARLEESIRHSGLFYESHLARWFKGEMPRQQLQQEPQMWRTLPFTLTSARQGDTAPSGLAGPRDLPFLPGAPLPRGANPGPQAPPTGAPLASPPPANAAPAAAPAAAAREPMAEPLPRAPAGPPIHESLQGIVRHQLEMLVTPALRWEGDVWSGLFMALVIQLPPGHQDRPSGEQDDSSRRDAEQRGWRSEIDLEVDGLGRLTASLWMDAERVEIDLRLARESSRQRLEHDLESLRARLAGHGFGTIQVELGPLMEESTP
ncbi:Flagellar hook-length control protein FliK [Halomonas sp. THAF5a]|uniref:flagellar hook-length control protein FliK n=1 Tax=Halomonas sp. THAF5a TaxID=2587844 RepID=UPI0012679ED1|nr:flagellar hook-length control protein FliK [Halomonas sp. THAF5a]QFU00103.1 Flagellar hook-length control protein FliK [Halomonas sp. THAF5a]